MCIYACLTHFRGNMWPKSLFTPRVTTTTITIRKYISKNHYKFKRNSRVPTAVIMITAQRNNIIGFTFFQLTKIFTARIHSDLKSSTFIVIFIFLVVNGSKRVRFSYDLLYAPLMFRSKGCP